MVDKRFLVMTQSIAVAIILLAANWPEIRRFFSFPLCKYGNTCRDILSGI